MIEKCLKSLQKQTAEHKVIVVDNGSTDGSDELVKANFPEVKLIKKSKNHGFAGGVNIGIKQALAEEADYIALLNNDAVAKPDWLENLSRTMLGRPEAGIVTSKLMRSDKEHFDSTGDFYSIWGMPFPRGRNQRDKGQYDDSGEVFGASGGASLYRASMLREIGLFDERFFAYFEDVDISFRAQLARRAVIYCPAAIAYHEVSATSSRMAGSFTRYHSIKNLLILYTKNMPATLYWLYLPLFVLQMLRLGLSSFVKGGAWAYLQAIVRFVICLPGILKDRCEIQKSRKVSVGRINRLLFHRRPPRIPRI